MRKGYGVCPPPPSCLVKNLTIGRRPVLCDSGQVGGQFNLQYLNNRLSPGNLGIQLVIAGVCFVALSLVRLGLGSVSAVDLRHGAALRAATGVGMILLFGFMLYRLYVSIIKPIERLSLTIQDYRNGNFGARARISGRNEIGYLEASFNDLAETTSNLVNELRALDLLKSEFLSTVSHELRTPLTSIGGYARLLRDGDAGPLNETQAEFLGIIETNVARLSGLINDLLDVEKLESGRMQVDYRPQELRSVLKECVETLGVLASRKGLKLDLVFSSDCANGLGPVLGDRDQLLRIFVNLISNAIKYTPSGWVRVEASQSPLGVTVRVRDTGVGLSAEERERLFRKFYRAKSGLTSGEGGSGLGLVITRGLVEAHQGGIEVESEPGQGTVFTVTFPRAVDRADQNFRQLERPRSKLEGRPSSDNGFRILIADPETDKRILIKRALLQKGFLVDDVPTGRQLIRRMEQEDYNLVLVELGLSDISGLEALQAIRRNPRWAGLPVFMMLDEAANPPPRAILASCGADQLVGKYRGIGGVVDAVISHFQQLETNRSEAGP